MGTTQFGRKTPPVRRPAIGGQHTWVAVIVIALIALVITAVVLLDRRQPSQVPNEPSTISLPQYEYLRVSFLGDEYAQGAGTRTKQGYTDLLARQLCWRTTVDAEPGSGFVVTSPGSTNYADPTRLAAVTANDPELIIVQASAADPANGQVANQSTIVVNELRTRAPDARIIVMGPLDPPAIDLGTVQALRSELRSSAEAAGATFIDPLDETAGRWLGQVEYSDDRFVPNSSGHSSIARRLTDALNKLGLPRVYACDAVN